MMVPRGGSGCGASGGSGSSGIGGGGSSSSSSSSSERRPERGMNPSRNDLRMPMLKLEGTVR